MRMFQKIYLTAIKKTRPSLHPSGLLLSDPALNIRIIGAKHGQRSA